MQRGNAEERQPKSGQLATVVCTGHLPGIEQQTEVAARLARTTDCAESAKRTEEFDDGHVRRVLALFFLKDRSYRVTLLYVSSSFLKVGNSPKMSPTETDGSTIQANSSWRQTILNRVVTPNKDRNSKDIEKVGVGKHAEAPVNRRTKQELRDLWKKAINQQLILIRMEKENAKLRGKHLNGKATNICISLFSISFQKKKKKTFQNVRRRRR